MGIKDYFSSFLKNSILIVLFSSIIMSIIYIVAFSTLSKNVILYICVAAVYVVGVIIYKKNRDKVQKLLSCEDSKTILYIVVFAFIIRIIWVLVVPTKPVSDFEAMYSYAESVARGDYYGFKGNSYFARFSHDTITVLYFSVFYHFMENPLILIKFFNVIWQTVSVFSIYILIKELIGKISAVKGALVLSIFPPFIMYTSQAASENIAMPFFIFAIYLFIKGIRNDRWTTLLLCGSVLSLANMFRMVGIIFLIGFFMYSIIYKGIKKCLKAFPIIVASYVLIIFIVSQSLVYGGVIENHLWQGKEPMLINVLKGTNIESHGRWNEEDQRLSEELNYDAEKINKVAKDKIIERLTNTPPATVVLHYVVKLALQWGMGDFGGYQWAIESSENTPISTIIKDRKAEIFLLNSLIYLTILIKIFNTMFKREYRDYEEINLLFIILGGFVLLLLIIESQERYSFIIIWTIIIFAAKPSGQPALRNKEYIFLRNKRNEEG